MQMNEIHSDNYCLSFVQCVQSCQNIFNTPYIVIHMGPLYNLMQEMKGIH